MSPESRERAACRRTLTTRYLLSAQMMDGRAIHVQEGALGRPPTCRKVLLLIIINRHSTQDKRVLSSMTSTSLKRGEIPRWSICPCFPCAERSSSRGSLNLHPSAI